MGARRKPAFVDRAISPKWGVAIGGLTKPQLSTITGAMRDVAFPARSILFREGEPSDALFVVREGRVRLYQTREDGEEFTYGICVRGTLLGLAALVLDKPRILSVQALEPTVASVMSRADFVRCTSAIPLFQANIARVLATLALESIGRSGPMALDPVAVRLAIALKSLARPDGSDPRRRRRQVVGLSHEELGKMIGASRAWVGVALGEFERLGLIEKSRANIVIKDAHRFASIAPDRLAS